MDVAQGGNDGRAVPHVKGWPIIGAVGVFGPRMHRTLEDAHGRFGDVFTLQVGPYRMWSSRDPALVEEVLFAGRAVFLKTGSPAYETLAEVLGQGLVTSEGPGWLKHRRLAAPAFHKERIAAFATTMATLADETAARFDRAAASHERIDVAREMLLFTQRVIARTMLSIDIDGEKGRVLGDALETGLRAVEFRVNLPVRPPLWVPLPVNRRLVHAKKTLDAFLLGLIAERRAVRAAGHTSESPDLLDLFMDAIDEETGATLSDADLLDEVMTIFAAGHETTSNLLSWTFAALGRDPALADRLADALSGVKPLDAARPGAVPLLDRTIDESLRWRPPVWAVDRVAAKDTTLGGQRVAKGDIVLLAPWLLHRDVRWWPDPERFDPDRFLSENSVNRPKFAYFPFLAGQRKCIGDQFALTEARIALATWLPKFRVVTEGVPDEELAVTMRPKGGLPARIERR